MANHNSSHQIKRNSHNAEAPALCAGYGLPVFYLHRVGLGPAQSLPANPCVVVACAHLGWPTSHLIQEPPWLRLHIFFPYFFLMWAVAPRLLFEFSWHRRTACAGFSLFTF